LTILDLRKAKIINIKQGLIMSDYMGWGTLQAFSDPRQTHDICIRNTDNADNADFTFGGIAALSI
jgi:hypothetical protein